MVKMQKISIAFLICFIGIGCFLICDRVSGKEWISYTTRDGLVDNAIRCITVDGKKIWFGTGYGVSCFEKNKWTTYTTKDGLSSNQVNAILIDAEIVWFGTKNGLCSFNKKKKKWSSYTTKDGLVNNCVNTLASNEKFIWIGTEGGLSRLDKASGKFTTYTTRDGLFNERVKDIIIDGGYLVVGTVGTVINVLDLVTHKWKIYSPETILYANTVLTREAGTIWCGTNGGGIRAYNKKNKDWKEYTIKEGLTNNLVQAITSDGIHIWIGTFDGVSCFDRVTGKWKNFSSGDGLVNDSVTAVAIDGEYVWFGTDEGISRYNKEVPQVAICLTQSYLPQLYSPLKIDCIGFTHEGIKEMIVEYSIDALSDVWIKEGIRVTSSKEARHLTINWDIDELPSPNDIYNLRLTVYDRKGRHNKSTACLIIDTVQPLLTIDRIAGPVSTGMQTISGEYNKGNVEKIVIEPGNILASIDVAQRKYACLVTLKEGKNPIKVTLYDRLGRKVQTDAVIMAKGEASGVTIKVDKVGGAKKKEFSTRLTLQEKLLFTSGNARIRSEGIKVLEKISAFLERSPKTQIKIEGHTDNVPIGKTCLYRTNKELSNARAQRVFKHLIQKSSISVERFQVKGYGESRPIVSNSTAKGRARNRRVEIIIVNSVE